MDLKKARTIAKAFMEKLPEDQQWYKDRLAICATCPKNTANIPSDKLTFVDKAKIAGRLCDNGNHCTVCGCCIERKAATKSEQCGLGEIGEQPKWPAIEVSGAIDKSLSLINISTDKGKVRRGTSDFIYDLENVSDPKVEFSFQLHRGRGLDIKNYQATCGCTVGDMEVVDNKTVNFHIAISTIGFRQGLVTKSFTVTYFEKSQRTRDVKIVFNINYNGK